MERFGFMLGILYSQKKYCMRHILEGLKRHVRGHAETCLLIIFSSSGWRRKMQGNVCSMLLHGAPKALRAPYICVYLHAYTFIYITIYIYTFKIYIYIYIYVYVYKYTHICIRIHTYLYIYMYTYINIYIYICIYVCIYVCMQCNVM